MRTVGTRTTAHPIGFHCIVAVTTQRRALALFCNDLLISEAFFLKTARPGHRCTLALREDYKGLVSVIRADTPPNPKAVLSNRTPFVVQGLLLESLPELSTARGLASSRRQPIRRDLWPRVERPRNFMKSPHGNGWNSCKKPKNKHFSPIRMKNP